MNAMLLYLYPIFLGLSFHLTHSLLGVLCAWIFLVGWSVAYQQNRASYLNTLVAGMLFSLIACSWLPMVLQGYFDISYPLGLLLNVVVAIVLGSQWVFVHWVYVTVRLSWVDRLLLRLPFAWCVAEILYIKIFPWSLASTQMNWPEMQQVADIGGAPLVSFFILWIAGLVGSILSALYARKTTFPLRKSIAACVLLTAILLYGKYRMQEMEQAITGAPTIDVGVVQPEFDPKTHFQKEYVARDMEQLRSLSSDLFDSSTPELMIWPESSVVYTYWSQEQKILKNTIRDPYPNSSVPLLFGGQVKINKSEEKYHNSALLLSPQGEFIGRYYKQILFPYAEEVPLSEYFPILSEVSRSPFILIPGENQGSMNFTTRSYDKKTSYSLGTVICYEDMIPWPLMQIVHQSEAIPDFLVAISNDSWFLHTIAPMQHHVIASLRAIEFRRFFVRVSVDGMSGMVDPTGQSIHMLSPFVSSWKVMTVPLLRGKTFFVQYGAKVSYLLSHMVLLWSIFIFLSDCFAMLFRKA